jgi:hypothetical protein
VSLKSFFNRFLSSRTAASHNSTDSSSDHSNTANSANSSSPVMGEMGMEKLKAVIDEVTSSFPLFEKAGFHVEEVQVEIGMTPKLMPRFKQVKEVSVSEQEALLQQAGEKKLVKFMLISLFKSSKMKNLINDPKLDFHGIEIDLTAVPSVRSIFRSAKNCDNVVRLDSHDHH